jgi:hypothetical protein
MADPDRVHRRQQGKEPGTAAPARARREARMAGTWTELLFPAGSLAPISRPLNGFPRNSA